VRGNDYSIIGIVGNDVYLTPHVNKELITSYTTCGSLSSYRFRKHYKYFNLEVVVKYLRWVR
jgi:hypothetical protein